MIKPYYEDDLVTLFHGSCLDPEIAAVWSDCDVLVTDPPYGMAYRAKDGREVAGDETTEVRDAMLNLWDPDAGLGVKDRPALVFGTWRVPKPLGVRQTLVWEKGDSPGMGCTDLPWGSNTEELYVFGTGFHTADTGDAKDSKRATSVIRLNNGDAKSTAADKYLGTHPTPKPVSLMTRLLMMCPSGSVAEPFAGSGATLRACATLGIHCVGVELEERYCAEIVDRLAQMSMFG